MRPVDKTFRKGEVIIKQGHHGRTFYVIRQGMVEVIKTQRDREVVIATLGPNEFFGEMSLIDEAEDKRSATVRAVEDTTVTIMVKEHFDKYLGQLSPGVRNLLNKLTSRLRETNQLLDAQDGEEVDPESDKAIEASLTLDELEQARDHAVDISLLDKKVPAGRTLLKEGDAGYCGFIVRKGRLEVSRTVKGRKVVLGILSENDIVGESALFNKVDRNATVTALEDSELLVFGKRDVINMTRRSPLELFMIMDSMSLKLDRINESYGKSLIDLDIARQQVGKMSGMVDQLNEKISLLESENLMLEEKLSRFQDDQAEEPGSV